jgi:hypothetical protein
MANGFVKTYDPKKVIVTFGGVPLTGFADGTFVSVTAPTDRFSKKVGADGEVARTRSNDDTHEVTLTLIQTSLSNSYLSSIAAIDKVSNLGIRPLTITDLSGGTIFFWPQAWIRKTPDTDFAKESGDRAWVFDTGQSIEESVNGDFLPG